MENNNFELIKEIIIRSPPTYWDLIYKKPKYDTSGKLIEKQRFYLTNNLFYADRSSYHITSKIIQDCKIFLKENIGFLPELEKMRLESEYRSIKDIDIDNKLGFWVKLLLDVLKIPTSRQIENSVKRKKEIITTNTIYDDTTKCIDEITMKWKKDEHVLIFRIYGRAKSEQKELNLFFK